MVVEVAASSRAAIAANPSIAGSHGRRKAARVKQQQAEAATFGVRAVGGADGGAASTASGGQKRRSYGHGSHGRKLVGLKARQQRLPNGSSRWRVRRGRCSSRRRSQQPARAAARPAGAQEGWLCAGALQAGRRKKKKRKEKEKKKRKRKKKKRKKMEKNKRK